MKIKTSNIFDLIKEKEISYVRIGEFNYLSLGFGRREFTDDTTISDDAEFNLVSYTKAWRFVKDKKIITSGLSYDSLKKIQQNTQFIIGMNVVGVRVSCNLDLIFDLIDGTYISFCSFRNNENLVEIFLKKEKQCVCWRPRGEWTLFV